jgi:predicted nucleic acid-binding protein
MTVCAGRPGHVHAVVHTSVLVKWLAAPTQDHPGEAGQLLGAQRSGSAALVAPASAMLELADVVRNAGMSAHDATDLLSSIVNLHVWLVHGTDARVHSALSVAFRHGISVYDAAYLSLAEELNCPLVTADPHTFGSIASPGVEIRLIDG